MHFMGRALAYFPDREFPPPAGVTFARVNAATGKAVLPGSGEGLLLPFKLGTVPEVAAPAGKPAGPRRGAADDLL
jgi:hypothetical protein